MMIVVSEDMDIIDGNHRMQAALNVCEDIRRFRLRVVMQKRDGKRVPGVVYFNTELNRLAVREEYATA